MRSLFTGLDKLISNLFRSFKAYIIVSQKDSQGRVHGVWETYYTDGTLKRRDHFHHGTLHGVSEWYYTDGTIWQREYYINIK